jgi:SAM-dependent methyltransferase
MRDEIRQLWRKLGRKKRTAWPQVEQGQYRSYRAVHPFDKRFGVETSGLIYDLPTGHAHDVYNNGYFAVAPSVFHAVMRMLLERLHLDCQLFRFVDVGSGKGRALLLASDYPFREVIGVELSPDLDRVARANVAHYAAAAKADPYAQRSLLHRPPVIPLQGDATEFLWPPGPLVVYMWNAFTTPVMERVFQNLGASLAEQPRELYLVYMHPELESMLASLPWLTMLWREEIAMSEEDYAAWAFPTREEMCAVYQALPSPATARRGVRNSH